MKKIILALALIALLLVLSGCPETGTDTTPEPEDSQPGNGDTDTGPTPKTRTYNIQAKQWEFNPSTITVNEGDTVVLSVTSIDVTHGFSIPEFGVSERLEPNQTVEVRFVADRKGSFEFRCNVVCGAGHGTMAGTLVVQ